MSDEILEKIFTNKSMQEIPIATQTETIKVFDEILGDILKENPYATVSELF